MKLLFITQNEAPFRMRWMDELAKYIDVTVFHLNKYDKNINSKYINYHTKIAKTYDISRVFFNCKLFRLKRITKEQSDILLLDGYGFFAQQILIIYLVIKNKKFGLSIDGGFIPTNENKIKKIIKTFFIKNATFYLSTSDKTDDFIIHYGAKRKNIYRHHFSNVESNDIIVNALTNNEKNLIRDKLELDNKFTIITVGQIIPRKGFDILLESIKKVKFDFQLLIIGTGDDRKTLAMIDEDERVKHIEFVTKDVLCNYYLASNLFILPTREDVWGLVIGEAMAKGLPIISTNRCLAAEDMIRDGVNGFIVNPNDSNHLANIISKIYNENYFKMGQESLEIIKKYALENSTKDDIENLKKIYEDLKNDV